MLRRLRPAGLGHSIGRADRSSLKCCACDFGIDRPTLTSCRRTYFHPLFLNATRGNGTTNGAVFELNAVSNSGGTPVPDISLGLGNFDGNGNITSYTFDENNGGVLTTPSQNNYTGTYTVDPATVRVDVSP